MISNNVNYADDWDALEPRVIAAPGHRAQYGGGININQRKNNLLMMMLVLVTLEFKLGFEYKSNHLMNKHCQVLVSCCFE